MMGNFGKEMNDFFGIEETEVEDVEKIKESSERIGIDSSVIDAVSQDDDSFEIMCRPNTDVAELESVSSKKETKLEKDLFDDYTFARSNLKKIADVGLYAIEKIRSQEDEFDTINPDNMEVLSFLIKNTTNTNSKILDMHQQMRDMTGLSQKNQNAKSSTNIDKAVFVGTAEDLNKILESRNNGSNF